MPGVWQRQGGWRQGKRDGRRTWMDGDREETYTTKAQREIQITCGCYRGRLWADISWVQWGKATTWENRLLWHPDPVWMPRENYACSILLMVVMVLVVNWTQIIASSHCSIKSPMNIICIISRVFFFYQSTAIHWLVPAKDPCQSFNKRCYRNH